MPSILDTVSAAMQAFRDEPDSRRQLGLPAGCPVTVVHAASLVTNRMSIDDLLELMCAAALTGLPTPDPDMIDSSTQEGFARSCVCSIIVQMLLAYESIKLEAESRWLLGAVAV